MVSRIPLVVAVGLSVLGAICSAADGTVSGWLEAGGEKTTLTHVFAAVQAAPSEGGDPPAIAVLLSDQPVPQELRRAGNDWIFWAGDQAHGGRLKGIILLIDPRTNAWSHGQRLIRGQGLTMYSDPSPQAASRVLRFQPGESGRGEIAGKVSMSEALGAAGSGGPWRVEAEFRTPVAEEEPVTGHMTGAEAQASPQYKAVLAFFAACQRKNLEAIKKTMNAEAQAVVAKSVASKGKEKALASYAAMAAESAALRAVEVIVRSGKAEVKLSKGDAGSKEETTFKLSYVNGAWKLSQ